jgi:hypothetical protein
MLLGDSIASALAFVGITKERVSAAVGGDCGCAKRQAALNDWHRKWLPASKHDTALVGDDADKRFQEIERAISMARQERERKT